MESILDYVSRLDLQPLLSHVTKFEITALPEDVLMAPDADSWIVTVEKRGPDSWAVLYRSQAYDKDLKREHESIPSARTKKFKRNFRHSLPEAVAIAERLAPDLKMMGMTLDEFAAWYRNRLKEIASAESV